MIKITISQMSSPPTLFLVNNSLVNKLTHVKVRNILICAPMNGKEKMPPPLNSGQGQKYKLLLGLRVLNASLRLKFPKELSQMIDGLL